LAPLSTIYQSNYDPRNYDPGVPVLDDLSWLALCHLQVFWTTEGTVGKLLGLCAISWKKPKISKA